MRSSYREPAHRSGNALARALHVPSWKRSARFVGLGPSASGRASSTVKWRGDRGSR